MGKAKKAKAKKEGRPVAGSDAAGCVEFGTGKVWESGGESAER